MLASIKDEKSNENATTYGGIDLRVMLHSKIHRAYITNIDADYEGSITIDAALLEAADIYPYEQVHVLDCDNGARFITYAIPGLKGEISINGAAAKLVNKGDMVIILAYDICQWEYDAKYRIPKIVHVDEKNEIKI